MTNNQIIFLFVILFLLSVFSAAGNLIWMSNYGTGSNYLLFTQDEINSQATNFIYSFLTFFILRSNLIPISLIVTMELVKLVQAAFVNTDIDLYYSTTNTRATARTSNLMEDLGRVEYLFSDKTGTLTRNKMEFRCCTIAGLAYADTHLDRSGGGRSSLNPFELDDSERSVQPIEVSPQWTSTLSSDQVSSYVAHADVC